VTGDTTHPTTQIQSSTTAQSSLEAHSYIVIHQMEPPSHSKQAVRWGTGFTEDESKTASSIC